MGVESAKCSFLNSSTVQIDFSYDASVTSIDVGKPVTVLAKRIKALCTEDMCDYVYAVSSSTLTQAPANPVLPKVVLNVPSLISPCDTLTVDATSTTGSGGSGG